MASSDRATRTVVAGRGDRAFCIPADYRILLPTLPAGDKTKNQVYLHCDVNARPLRIGDFKEPLEKVDMLKEVAGLGVCQMGHVWLCSLKSAAAKERLLKLGWLTVKGKLCIPVDPNRQEVRVKLHWVPFDVPNDVLRRALEEYGTVNEVSKENWRVDGFEDIESTTRIAKVTLKEGMTPDKLPHQLKLKGGTILAVVPGRAPVCLRCSRAGHIRRDCRVPRCGECRGFGHVSQECVRSYASAVVNRATNDEDEIIMDETETEEAATLPSSLPETKEQATTGDATNGTNAAEATAKASNPDAEESGKETQATTAGGTDAVDKGDVNEPLMELDLANVKRRLDDETKDNEAQELHRPQGQWKQIGKKGRYTTKLRSSSLTRDGELSQRPSAP
ncbi:hypothetical protein ISCGN_032195 [Ixodes scapularis]